MIGKINGTNIFLTEDQLPAFTLSINDVTDPSKVRGTRSGTIRAVNTKELRRAVVSERMSDPRPKGRAELVIGNGDAASFRADVIPVDTNRNEAELIAVGGNAKWFDYAKRTKLQEFDFGQSGILLADDIAATWDDPDSLLNFPLVDFGRMEGRASSYNVLPEYLRPAFRIHRVIDEALKPEGYRMIPRGTLAAKWKKFGVLHPTDKVRTNDFFGNPKGAVVENSAGPFAMTITTLGTAPTAYQFGIEAEDPDGRFSLSTFRYTMGDEGTIDVRASMIAVQFDPFTPPAVGEVFTLTLWDYTAGAALATYSQSYVSGDTMWFNHTFRDIAVPSGHAIAFGVQKDPASTYTDPYFPSVYARGCFSPRDPLYTPRYYPYEVGYGGRPIVISSIMPSMTLMGLITALANDQNLAFVTDDNGTINVWYEREYMRKPAPGNPWRDWTGRVDHTAAPSKLIKDAPRRILFRFDEDEGDRDMLQLRDRTPYPEWANHDHENPIGYGEDTEIRVPFSPSAMAQAFGSTGPVIPVMRAKDGTYQADDLGRSTRLLVFDGMTPGDWTFNFATQTEAPFTYFTTDKSRGVALHFDNATAGYPGTITGQWAERLARMRNGRTIELYVRLRDSELQSFDHGIPTLVDDGTGPRWYYVAEINGHRFGKGIPTKCKLVEIPGTAVDVDAVTSSSTLPEYPALTVNPPFVPPCLNAPRFPAAPLAVDHQLPALAQSDAEADLTTYPVGVQIAITCIGIGGGGEWDDWTGDVVRRVAPGTGTGGSEWLRLNVAPYTLVEDLGQPSGSSWRFIMPYESSAPGVFNSGRSFTSYLIQPTTCTPAGEWSMDTVYNACAEGPGLVETFPRTDTCRRYIIQVNTTTDPNTGWVDIGDEEFFSEILVPSGTLTLPSGALYIRAKWMRGNYVQGYSQRTAIA